MREGDHKYDEHKAFSVARLEDRKLYVEYLDEEMAGNSEESPLGQNDNRRGAASDASRKVD